MRRSQHTSGIVLQTLHVNNLKAWWSARVYYVFFVCQGNLQLHAHAMKGGARMQRSSHLSSMSRVMCSLGTQEGGASIRRSWRSCTADARSCWRSAALSMSWAVDGLDAGSVPGPGGTWQPHISHKSPHAYVAEAD